MIFQNRILTNLAKYPHYAAQASSLAADAAALVQTIRTTPAGSSDKLDLQTAYTDSLRTVYVFICALSGVALLTTGFIKAYDINVALETRQGLVEKERKKKKEEEEEDGGVVDVDGKEVG